MAPLRPRPIAFVLLVTAASLLWAGQSPAHRTMTSPERMPTTVGFWVGAPLTVSARAREILETDDVALMEYRRGEESPVWLARVAGFGTRAAFHPPELCYVGSHFEVLERGVISVTVNGQPRRLMRLVIGQEHQRFEAWYWFTANGRVTPSYYEQQWWLAMDAMRRQPLSGSLIRISTPFDDAAKSTQRLTNFLSAFDATPAERS